MFGMNSTDKHLSIFSNFSDATTEQIDGNSFDLDWVDWDKTATTRARGNI